MKWSLTTKIIMANRATVESKANRNMDALRQNRFNKITSFDPLYGTDTSNEKRLINANANNLNYPYHRISAISMSKKSVLPMTNRDTDTFGNSIE